MKIPHCNFGCIQLSAWYAFLYLFHACDDTKWENTFELGSEFNEVVIALWTCGTGCFLFVLSIDIDFMDTQCSIT